MKLSKFSIFLIGMLVIAIAACSKHEASTLENLTAAWNSTAIKIDGVASPSTTTMFLHLQASNQFEIATNITPFTQPKSGVWSMNSAGDKLTLAGNIWTIHHVDGSTLRLEYTLDGKELEIDFKK